MLPHPRSEPARFRLRFLFQEFDLPSGITLIGRGSDCHVTLYDPLVSRHHARIHVDAVRAIIEDLGSRNGSRVNGVVIEGPTVLSNGDRIRVGTQELVLAEIEQEERSWRRTGSLVHCADCKQPYPKEIGACPACGSAGVVDVDGVSPLSPGAMRVWAFDMVLELLGRALPTGNLSEIERVLYQASGTFRDRLMHDKPIDPKQLDTLLRTAEVLLSAGRRGNWVAALTDLCARVGHPIPPALVRDDGFEVPTEISPVNTNPPSSSEPTLTFTTRAPKRPD